MEAVRRWLSTTLAYRRWGTGRDPEVRRTISRAPSDKNRTARGSPIFSTTPRLASTRETTRRPLSRRRRAAKPDMELYSKFRPCCRFILKFPSSFVDWSLPGCQNCLARSVVKAPKSSHITPVLRSLYWLKINERIEYEFLLLAYKVLTISQSNYLHNLISVQSSTLRTRSSSTITLDRPSVS